MKLINIALLLFISIGLTAQESDATYHKIYKTYTLNEDGSYVYEYSHQLKYNSYLSFHRLYGETFVVYNPEYQKVEVLECKTTMANGKEVVAPENAFNEVLPSYAAASGAYNHLRELVITHTGLEVGAVVDLKYQIKSEKSPMNIFAGQESLIQSSPIDELIITFNVPISRTISFAGNVGERIINENDQIKTYVFMYKNIPASSKYNSLVSDEVQKLLFNEGKSLQHQATEVMKDKKVLNLDLQYKNANSLNLKEILATHYEVVKYVKSVFVPYALQHFPIPSEEVIEQRNSGTPIEKVLLLRKKLLDKNIAATLAFSIPVELYDPLTTSFESISDFYVMVPHENGDPILLPSSRVPKTNELYTQYQKVFLALDENGDLVRLMPNTTNYAETKMNLSIDINDPKITYEANVAGVFSMWPQSKFKTSQLFTSVKEVINEATINGKDPFAFGISGSFKPNHKQTGSYLEIALPIFLEGLNNLSIVDLPQKSEYNICYEHPLKEKYLFTIDLSGKQTIVRKPGNHQISNEFFEMSIQTKQTGNKLTLEIDYIVKVVKIPNDSYQSFRNALIMALKEESRTIIINSNE